MKCAYYSNNVCRSCQWLEKPYHQQLDDKQQHLRHLLSGMTVKQWLPTVTSAPNAFRNKAKMAVSGQVERPILGIVNQQNDGVDLCHCPLYPDSIQAIFPLLKTFIAKAGLVPYDIGRKRGELKYILLTESRFNQQIMLRFVLRSEAKLPQLSHNLSWLLEQLPQLAVVTANIQPIHMAILEGEVEYSLTAQQTLEEQFNGISLFIRPHSFFQTNPEVAEKLYATAREWVDGLQVSHIWDLFCGVGGFGLHCATQDRQLTGIEISTEAIRCAQQSAEKLGLNNIEFTALDSTQFAKSKTALPDLVLVNPPRRGIGQELCDYLAKMAPDYLIYSSCNAQSMVNDLHSLPNYYIDKIKIFDMFPHTAHYEVMVLLVNKCQRLGYTKEIDA